MWIRRLAGRSSAALILAALASFASSARAQNPQSPPTSPESDVKEMRAENGLIREQLRKLEEQQKTLLQLVDELRRRFDGSPATITNQSLLPTQPDPQAPTQAAVAIQPAADRSIAADDPYEDSIVLVKTPEDARVPILLRFWDISQLRYTNSQLGNDSYIDHLGAVRPVTRRNDFSLNRNMFQFTGYIFDKRLQYNLIIWASNTSAAVVIGGFVSWRFNKAITLYSGYWGPRVAAH